MNAQMCSLCGNFWTKCRRDRGRLQFERDGHRAERDALLKALRRASELAWALRRATKEPTYLDVELLAAVIDSLLPEVDS